MNTRKAVEEDAEGIAKVLVASYNIESVEEGMEAFRTETKKEKHYLVAEEDSKILGIVTWMMHGLPKHQLCELDRIAVLPESKGKGVAKQLFDALVKDAGEFFKKHNSKLRKLYLLCHADNERAHSFYKKMSFKHETTLKEHYYKDKDEFVFSILFD
jgi:ribosomal protein S18 acetylase RimI-like enzyme